MSYNPTAYWLKQGRAKAVKRDGDATLQQEQVLAELLNGLTFDSVLEVGCGDGRVTALVQRHRPASYLAIDLSPHRIATASKRVPGVEFEVSSLEDFEPSGRRWDLVIAAEVLMHIPTADIAGATNKLAYMSNRHVVTVDWAEGTPTPDRPKTDWCFLHDYPALYDGLGTLTAYPVEVARNFQQSIFHLEKA